MERISMPDGVTDSHVTAEDLTILLRDTADAASAFMRGDMRRYLELIRHADDYTLMTPFGGEIVRGFDMSDEYRESLEEYFRGGEAEQEVIQTYASGNLAVLVVIERQHGVVGGLPDQEWPLRVTLVFRHDGNQWWQVHRHADPLVHAIDLSQLSILARGDDWSNLC
jgi:ketosteroid isomerase-like protein